MSEAKRSYFNDSPIEAADDDRYGVTSFAKSLAKSIAGIDKPIGTTIALNGAWGSGKSSIVNLIRTELSNSGNEKLVVSDFKCWWFRGEEALALAFLQSLDGILRSSLGNKVKNLIPRISKRLLQAGPTLGAAITLASGTPLTALLGDGAKFVSTFFPDDDTLEKTFQKLATVLANEDRRFLIVIDDIDRLSPDEAIAIFRLVKSVGRLPNVMYLLVFDRDLAEKAVQERFPSEGPHFLEKIVQAGFEVPNPLKSDLNQTVLAEINEICGDVAEDDVVSVMNLFYDVVVPYMVTPRHVARYRNAISVTWPAVAGEISLADFIALEALRLYEPTLFQSIRSHKDQLCGASDRENDDNSKEILWKQLLDEVPASRHEIGKRALQRLFPSLQDTIHGSDWVSLWDAKRRVCVDSHFDTYFRLSLSDEVLSVKVIEEIITKADDPLFVKATFRQAAKTIRANGVSMVPVYLDELNTHASRIDVRKVPAFLAALFEIHDEIDLQIDAGRGLGNFGNTSLRYHWLLRRATESMTPEQRSDVLTESIKSASLGWLVDFTSSAMGEHSEKRQHGPKSEEDCLLQVTDVEVLRKLALNSIRTAAANGTLITHQDLVYILYRWREFLDGDTSEILTWTNDRIQEDRSLVALARDFTGRSWSMGMGGFGSLGDRVSKVSIVAQIGEDTDIVDTSAFYARLEEVVAARSLGGDDLEAVTTFLNAWKQNRR
jgi:predicted KAP-like P-loop ATPase